MYAEWDVSFRHLGLLSTDVPKVNAPGLAFVHMLTVICMFSESVCTFRIYGKEHVQLMYMYISIKLFMLRVH